MAPITRNAAMASRSLPPPQSRKDGIPKIFESAREPSWQFPDPEMRSEREMSEGPSSSYDEAEFPAHMEGDDDDDYGRQAFEEPDDHEDILHPLREAANRVGREVERFAEVLDRYNPLRVTAEDEKREMTTELLDQYHGIAVEAVERLRERHDSGRRKTAGLKWRQEMRGMKNHHDRDEMDMEDLDGPDSVTDLNTNTEDLRRWEQEAETWDLLRRLVALRFPPSGSKERQRDSEKLSRRPHRYSTEREIWLDFLDSNDMALERKTILQWLQDTAEESGEDIDVLVRDLQHNANRGEIIAHGWLHTKEAIKSQKRMHAWPQTSDSLGADASKVLNSSKTEHLVTQLDPDAPTRQGRKLEPYDEYFERAIWLGCYQMLRRGTSGEEIREWCSERTEIWRAVSMSSFLDETTEHDVGAESPSSSSLWRRICFALARQGGTDNYERAVYGIICGDIQSIEPVSQSWNDIVFAHYNAFLKAEFSSHLQSLYSQSTMGASNSGFIISEAIQPLEDAETASIRLVESLKTDDRTAAESLQPMKMLQGVLIANQFHNYIYQQGLALSKFANAESLSNLIPPTREQPENEEVNKYIALDDRDSLRVLAHILLIYISLGLDLGGLVRESVIQNIIVSYISFLRLAGKEELIPLYCSQLSGPARYATLCRNLIDITDHGQRLTQIRLMRELGLDVQEFVKLQSKFLFTDYPEDDELYPATGNFKLVMKPQEPQQPQGHSQVPIRADFIGGDTDSVDKVDMLFIRSLEWYLLVDGLWSETFTIGTMVYLRFFKHIRLMAARMLSLRVPGSAISRSKSHAILGENLDFMGLEADREDDDLTEVLDGSADRKRLLRRHLLAEARSFRELEALIVSLDHIETTTDMMHLEEEFKAEDRLKEWRPALAKELQPTKASMQPLLKGWLLASQQEIDEFRLLREAYLPETILAYVEILRFAGGCLTRDFHMECMDLSAHMAAEGSDLLDVFIKTGRIQDLVEAFASVSKALLIETSARQSSSTQTKKLRARGWTHDLWSISN